MSVTRGEAHATAMNFVHSLDWLTFHGEEPEQRLIDELSEVLEPLVRRIAERDDREKQNLGQCTELAAAEPVFAVSCMPECCRGCHRCAREDPMPRVSINRKNDEYYEVCCAIYAAWHRYVAHEREEQGGRVSKE